MLSMDGAIIAIALEKVEEVAELMNLERQDIWRRGGQIVRFEDSRTGGGEVRLNCADGVCWISRHGGYNGDQTGLAAELLFMQGGFEIMADSYRQRPDFTRWFEGDEHIDVSLLKGMPVSGKLQPA